VKTTPSAGKVIARIFFGGGGISRRLTHLYSDRTTNHQRSLLFEAS